MDIRKTIAEQIGLLVLTNIELTAQLEAAHAEIEKLKAPPKDEAHDDSK